MENLEMDFEMEKAKIRKQVKLAEYRKQYRREIQTSTNKNSTTKKYKKKDHLYFFITINPMECDIDAIEEIINIIKKKKYIKLHCYTFEQRGININELGKGKHIHMIIDKTLAKSDILRFIHSSIKKYCTIENIDIRKITENGKIVRENYMKGHKSFEKLESVEIDKIWRKENNLQDFYEIIKSNTLNDKDIRDIKDEEFTIIEKEIGNEKGFENMKVKISTEGKKKTITLINNLGELQVYGLVELKTLKIQ